MIFLGYSPYIIFTSFLTILLLDRRVCVTGNKQFPTSSPWYPSGSSSDSAKTSNDESEALKKVLPLVTFDCRGKTGYFPDSKFNCEVFHYCQSDGGRNTFHCPAHQLFNQLSMVCEEKTVHNSRLCKEGSISSRLQRLLPNNRKQHDVSHKTASPIFKPSLNANSSKEPSKKVMTLEDLLSYMNSGHGGKDTEPTFISRFHNAEDSKQTTNSSESAITSTIPNTKSDKETMVSTTSEDIQLTAVGSDQSFSIAKASKPKNKEGDEDISTEYDAIEGRKFRKHKRIGRVIDLPANQQSKQEDKPSARSATLQPFADDVTLPPMDDAELKNTSSHSLFSADRTRARDFRKRKRYQGRKRKVLTPESMNETETGTVPVTYTTTENYQVLRQDSDMLRNNAHRRRKSQRTRIRDGSFQSSPKSEKVEPYTLPPLPNPTGDAVEVTTDSMNKEEKRDFLKEGRSKNPWHKPTSIPEDETSYKFGEKVTDQHHYQVDEKIMETPRDTDYYETKDIPNTSEELMSEKYREKVLMHSKISSSTDMRPNHKPKVETLKKTHEEDSFKYETRPEINHHIVETHNIFPPPRAEAREHHSSTPQQMIHDSNTEKSKTTHNPPKATTEDPFRVTHPYMGKYQTEIKELKDIEDQRWKIESEKAEIKEKKLPVGSTFFFQNSDAVETTKKPRVRDPPSTETPTRAPHKEKDIIKHTLAHQHLSKIMNDFFAMSSSNRPGRIHAHGEKEEEDMITPEYRIPDEDIYASSESVNEDMEEIPPELLEVVDLLTGHVSNDKSNLKPHASHEVIKINGPITDSHLEKIFMDDKFDEDMDHKISADGSYKQIVVVPQPEEKEEEEEDYKDIAEVAEFTSLKLESLLKHISREKSSTSIPLKSESVLERQPKLLTAKKIPIRFIYRDQLTEASPSKQEARQPQIKLLHSNLPTAHLQLIRNGGRANLKPVTRTFSSHTQPSIILHPSSLFPPHPPPLQNKQLPFRVGYPFVTNNRPFMQNARQVPRRRKRSTISRFKRQMRQNQNFLPFSSPVFPAFNPKFLPTFSPFRSLFNPVSLHTAGSHLSPFSFPGFHIAKPSQNRPHIFQPSHPRPPSVRHVTQNGQTVIVEEVPVPIHVEVPSPNLILPVPPAAHPSKNNQRYTGNQFRTPSPPAIQTPPLIQRPRNRFPPPPPPPQPNSYRPIGMPSNARPPAINYQPSISFSAQLPPSITSEGQLYALGVTNKPLSPPQPKPRPARPLGPNSARISPRPYNPFDIHPSGYPSFPYFQGAFTTPISNEPVPGRLMYSGYRPPKSTLGTKSPKPRTQSNKDRKPSESQSTRSRSKNSQDYFEAPTGPMRESHVSYTEEVISRVKPRTKPNLNDYSTDHSDFKSPRPNLSKGPTSDESTPRKRRPGKRRRPRPYSTTTQGTTVLNDISPTPPPPEQIPPPPADYTSKPAHLDVMNSLPSFSEATKTHETSSHFPPAGYYGKDQLVQFFDSSSKTYQKTSSPKPHHHKDLGESTSSAEMDESFTNISGEDGNDEPAFGTRLRSKPQSKSRSRQLKNRQPAQSQSQNTEIRTRPITRPDETTEQRKRGNVQRVQQQQKPNEGSRTQMKNENTLPRRRRPPPPRPRNRPQPMPQPGPEIHHFNYNENMGNFYTVPRGLQTLVAPSNNPTQGFRGSTDMFGLPHPVIDQSIYSLRPQGAPDFDSNFFSVPAHVAQQQHSPLHNMNVKPVPESAREFFTAPETGVTVPEASAPEKKETEPKSSSPSKPGGENNEQKEKPPVRKLRKPKRKNRYNPHSNEQRDSAEVNIAKPQVEPTTPRDSYTHKESNIPRESNTPRYKEKTTTSAATTTPEPRSTAAASFHSQNDIKESPTYKQRTPLIPKTLPEFSKPLLNGKIDFQKLNATISTSVSVSGSVPQNNSTSSEEKENKRVFSSQNGGLAVVRKGPKRKRARQRVSTTTGVPYVNSESSSDAKYEIAASVLDIIKATTETERQASGYYNKDEKAAPSNLSNVWVESKRTL